MLLTDEEDDSFSGESPGIEVGQDAICWPMKVLIGGFDTFGLTVLRD